MFGYSDPNTGIDQSEHAWYTCYFIIATYTAQHFNNTVSIVPFK